MLRLLVSLSLLVSSLAFAQTPGAKPDPIMAPGAESEPVPVPAVDEDRTTRFGLGLFLDAANKIRFKDYDNGAYKTDVDFDTESAWGISGSVQQLPRNSWGFLASLNIYTKRDIKKIPSGTVLNSNGPVSTLHMSTLDGSAAYRWQQFYIPFGLNISGLTYDDNGANPNINVKVTGGIGVQFGVGYMITQNFAAELLAKGVSFTMKTSGPSIPDETNTGIISSTNISARYIF
jgi:hypothetical protein